MSLTYVSPTWEFMRCWCEWLANYVKYIKGYIHIPESTSRIQEQNAELFLSFVANGRVLVPRDDIETSVIGHCAPPPVPHPAWKTFHYSNFGCFLFCLTYVSQIGHSSPWQWCCHQHHRWGHHSFLIDWPTLPVSVFKFLRHAGIGGYQAEPVTDSADINIWTRSLFRLS